MAEDEENSKAEIDGKFNLQKYGERPSRKNSYNANRRQVVREKEYRKPSYIRARSAIFTRGLDKESNNHAASSPESSRQTGSKLASEKANTKQVEGHFNARQESINERKLTSKTKVHSGRVWSKTNLNRHLLENLVHHEPMHIGKIFAERQEEFVKLMRHCSSDFIIVTTMLRLIAKIASGNRDYIIPLNSALNESLFLENIVVPYLLSLVGNASNNVDTVRNVLQLIIYMANNSVNSVVSFYSILTVLTELVEEIRASESIYHLIKSEIEEFDHIRSKVLTIRRNLEKRRKTDEDKYKPPDDFRTANIVPTAQDLLTNKVPFLRKNKAYGSFVDLEHYLDVQFRLLREDFIAPLRESILEYKTHFKDIQPGSRRFRDIRVYNGVRISGTTVNSEGIGQLLTFDTSTTQRINWEHSQRLKYGSLLCLSYDNFETIWFAVVTNREIEDLACGILEVQFTCGIKPLHYMADKVFIMAESDTYFEAYRHNLAALQNIKTLPFSNYIVNCIEAIDAPAYLRNDENVSYDLNALANENSTAQINTFGDTIFEINLNENPEISAVRNVQRRCARKDPELSRIPILADTKWPKPASLGLDKSQYRALKNALTHEFSITQGPPGAGKTYVGLKIAKALLANKKRWSATGNEHPILIVCYTNHALDQFLCGIHEFYNGKIVRVGGRSNETMQRHGIKTLYHLISDDVLEDFSVLRNIKDKTKERIDNIKHEIVMADSRVLHISQLRKYMGRLYHPLRLGFDLQVFHINRSRKKKQEISADWFHVMEEWLGCGRLLKNTTFKVRFRNLDTYGQIDTTVSIEKNEKNPPKGAPGTDNDCSKYYYQHISYVSKDCLRRQLDTANMKDKRRRLSESQKGLDSKTWVYFDDLPSATSKQSNNDRNIWNMDIRQRWQLYKLWTEQFRSSLEEKLKEYEEDYELTCQQLKKITQERDSHALRQADVIGMTTTGAARHFEALQAVKPKVVIVEEAAEVLEAHIVTSLSEECEHLILIGDHKQLKPSPAVYKLAKKFNLDISLFERMINNKIKYECLEQQHRMRPEISKIIKLFYPSLQDDVSVLDRPDIKGIASNVFFVSHSSKEELDKDSTSHSNEHEAQFLVALCRYLLKQEYKPSQITVLTTYSAQMFLLRKLMPKDSEFHGVTTTVVDNYQGEENDIILLSLVRSNPEEKIGFLNIENRVNVALSRARSGLFVIGNLDIMSKVSNIWAQILSLLQEENQTGTSLPLFCRNHPDKKIFASNAEDFLQAPEGGCFRECEARLDCGHVCRLKCHVYDTSHKMYQCQSRCVKRCPNNHQCIDLCHEVCSKCVVKVPKVMPVCGHTQLLPCHKDPVEWDCQISCEDILKCGHKCLSKCSDKDHKCLQKVNVTFNGCDHEMTVECHKRALTVICEMPCEVTLACQHRCANKCHAPHNSICREESLKTLNCKHTVTAPCYKKIEEISCPYPCEKTLFCGHQCKNNCGDTHTMFCEDIVMKELKCGHLLPLFCGENECEVDCPNPCSEKLDCGHTCENKCSEPHTTKCSVYVWQKCKYRHETKRQCHEIYKQSVIECDKPCRRKLACGHICRGTCHGCDNGRFHVPCAVCGLPDKNRHSATIGHGRIYPCVAPCTNQCSHRRCNKMCFEPCADNEDLYWPCREKCEWFCEHQKCSKMCYEQCDRDVCDEPCRKLINKSGLISKPCSSYCGETCGTAITYAGLLKTYTSSKRKYFHSACGQALEINELEDALHHDRNSCGTVCPRCSKPVGMDEKIYSNVTKQIYENKERKKLQSTVYRRHKEIERLLNVIEIKRAVKDWKNKRLSIIDEIETLRNSFELFLHFQRQGYKDMKRELTRLERMIDADSGTKSNAKTK